MTIAAVLQGGRSEVAQVVVVQPVAMQPCCRGGGLNRIFYYFIFLLILWNFWFITIRQITTKFQGQSRFFL